jgi:hypothetical protein
MESLFEEFKKRRKIKILKKFIIKSEKEPKSGLLTLEKYIGIYQCWKENNIDRYDDHNSRLLVNLLREIYGEDVDISLIGILDQLIETVNKIVNGRNDNRYNSYDRYIARIIPMLSIYKTPRSEKKVLSLLLEEYKIKAWHMIDDGLNSAVINLSSEDAIDAFIKFVTDNQHPYSFTEKAIIIQLVSLESKTSNALLKDKLQKVNKEMDIRRQNEQKAIQEYESRRQEELRIAEFKRKHEESEKWWNEHPDQERDPSRMDR